MSRFVLLMTLVFAGVLADGAVPAGTALARGPALAVEDAVSATELPDWDSAAFEAAGTDEVAETPDENEIEAEARGLEQDIFHPLNAPVAAEAPPEKDEREVLFTFAASRELAPSKGRFQGRGSETDGIAGPTAASPEAETHENGELALQLRAEKRVLPAAGLAGLSDARLRELCADLREASHLTIDSAPGASIRNFRQKDPLLLRVGRLGEVENLRARFVALVGGDGARIRRLRKVEVPHLVCGVRLSAVEDVGAPLIVVGAAAPRGFESHPRLRVVAPAARSAVGLDGRSQ